MSAAIDTFLKNIAKDLPGLISNVNASLATAGTSLPALEKAAGAMINDAVNDPGMTFPQVVVDGAEVAFAADPMMVLAIAVGYALYSSGVVKSADQGFFDKLDASRGEGSPYAPGFSGG